MWLTRSLARILCTRASGPCLRRAACALACTRDLSRRQQKPASAGREQGWRQKARLCDTQRSQESREHRIRVRSKTKGRIGQPSPTIRPRTQAIQPLRDFKRWRETTRKAGLIQTLLCAAQDLHVPPRQGGPDVTRRQVDAVHRKKGRRVPQGIVGAQPITWQKTDRLVSPPRMDRVVPARKTIELAHRAPAWIGDDDHAVCAEGRSPRDAQFTRQHCPALAHGQEIAKLQ